MINSNLLYVFLTIIFFKLAYTTNVNIMPKFIKILHNKKVNILRDNKCMSLSMSLSNLNNNKTIENLESVYFSKTMKIAVFKYNNENKDIEIVTNNLKDYYRNIYNITKNTNIQKNYNYKLNYVLLYFLFIFFSYLILN